MERGFSSSVGGKKRPSKNTPIPDSYEPSNAGEVFLLGCFPPNLATLDNVNLIVGFTTTSESGFTGYLFDLGRIRYRDREVAPTKRQLAISDPQPPKSPLSGEL